MLPPEISAKVPEYVDAWFKAEGAMKAFERLSATVMMASVQELRYAGRRFAELLKICSKNKPGHTYTPQELKDLDVEIVEAIQNCIKARHDAIDAVVHFIHKRLEALVKAVGLLTVTQHFPDYRALGLEMEAVDKKIVEAREDRSKLQINYDDIMRIHSNRIISFYSRLSQSEHLIREALKAEKRKRFWRDIVFVLLGVIPSLIASYLFALKW